MSLDIAHERRGDVHILVLGGRLDIDSAATLQLAVEDLMSGGARHLLLDAASLGYLSSAGLEVLVGLAERLRADGSLRVCGLGPAALETVAAAGQSQRLALFPDRSAALSRHPQAELDPLLVQEVARLLGAAGVVASASKRDPQLERAVGELLGVSAGGTKPRAAPASSGPEPVLPPPPAPGVLDKLKRLLGGRR